MIKDHFLRAPRRCLRLKPLGKASTRLDNCVHHSFADPHPRGLSDYSLVKEPVRLDLSGRFHKSSEAAFATRAVNWSLFPDQGEANDIFAGHVVNQAAGVFFTRF